MRINVKSNIIMLVLKWFPKCCFISERTYVTIHKDKNKTFILGLKIFLFKIKI